MRLSRHRPQPRHLPVQPLQRLSAAPSRGRRKRPVFLARYTRISARDRFVRSRFGQGATCTAPIAANSILCVFVHHALYKKAYSRGFKVRRCAALSAGSKARPVGSSALRVAARYPVAVRNAERKTRPHRRFARTVAPRSLVTRHLPLPVHLKLRQRLPRFASRRSARPATRSRASARRSRRCSLTSRARWS